MGRLELEREILRGADALAYLGKDSHMTSISKQLLRQDTPLSVDVASHFVYYRTQNQSKRRVAV